MALIWAERLKELGFEFLWVSNEYSVYGHSYSRIRLFIEDGKDGIYHFEYPGKLVSKIVGKKYSSLAEKLETYDFKINLVAFVEDLKAMGVMKPREVEAFNASMLFKGRIQSVEDFRRVFLIPNIKDYEIECLLGCVKGHGYALEAKNLETKNLETKNPTVFLVDLDPEQPEQPEQSIQFEQSELDDFRRPVTLIDLVDTALTWNEEESAGKEENKVEPILSSLWVKVYKEAKSVGERSEQEKQGAALGVTRHF